MQMFHSTILSPLRQKFGLNCNLLVALLIVVQLVDGVLTLLGVSRFGAAAEGNVLLRMLMGVVGVFPALLVAKGSAVFALFALSAECDRVFAVRATLQLVVVGYIVMAIIPWSTILVGA